MGDIVLSTDNEYFIKGSNKHQNIVTYEKGLARPAKMTTSNITATVLKGFGTGVGGFSNCATILYAMAAIFKGPEQKEQHDECLHRIKLLREIVGQEIDRIKGADKPSLPHEWKHFESVSPDDTPEERTRKFKRNALVISKKPYFFRYLYPELNKRFKQFESSYNQISRDMFGIKFKKLLKKEDKTEEEMMLVRKYQKYSPLVTSDCTMNRLCREFEAIDFDIQFAKDDNDKKHPTVSKLPTFEGVYGPLFNKDKLEVVKKMYKKYTSRKQIKYLTDIVDRESSYRDSMEYDELRTSLVSGLIEELQKELLEAHITGDEFLFYCSRLAPQYSSFNWGFAWDVLEDQIIKFIPAGKSFCPVRDPAGEWYLGECYILKDVSKADEIALQNLINSIFGDPEEIVDVSTVTTTKEEQN